MIATQENIPENHFNLNPLRLNEEIGAQHQEGNTITLTIKGLGGMTPTAQRPKRTKTQRDYAAMQNGQPQPEQSGPPTKKPRTSELYNETQKYTEENAEKIKQIKVTNKRARDSAEEEERVHPKKTRIQDQNPKDIIVIRNKNIQFQDNLTRSRKKPKYRKTT